MKSFYSSLVVSGIATLSAANAATVLQTQTKSFSFVPTGSRSLSFNLFDPSLGTLTGVTITTSLTKVGGSLSVDNDAASAASGSVSQFVEVDLGSSTVSLLNTSFQMIGQNIRATSSATLSVGANDGDGLGFHSGGSDFASTGTFANVTTTSSGSVSPLVFGQYTGVGTYSINVSGIQSLDISSISGASGAFDPATAQGSVTVTYEYTPANPIPEPSSLVALGGLLSLGVFSRSRRSTC